VRYLALILGPAAALFLLYLVAPQSINGSDFVAARIIPFAAAFAILAIEPRGDPRNNRWIASAAIAFLVVRTAGTATSFWLYDRSYASALAALDHVPDGSRIASFSPQGCTPSMRNWGNSRLQHLASMAIVRRNAFTNDQWTISGLQLVETRYRVASPFVGEPSEVVTLEPCTRPGVRYLPDAIAVIPRQAFDYVWLVGVPGGVRPRPPWLRSVYATADTELFRIERQPGR